MPGQVVHVERLGGEALVHLRIGPAGHALVAKAEGASDLAGGETVRMRFEAGHLFDSAGNAIESAA